jgi:PKD repeat protein
MKKQILKVLQNNVLTILLVISANSIFGQLVVNFSFTNDNECSGVEVSFISQVSGGSGNPQKWVYAWEIDTQFITNEKNFSYFFDAFGCNTQIYTVKLTVNDTTATNPLSGTITHNVTVKERPNPQIADILNNPEFNNCFSTPPPTPSNPNFTIEIKDFTNDIGCIIPPGIEIDWEGNGSFDESHLPGFLSINHTYTELGFFNLTVRATGQNGCIGTTIFPVRNETDPGGSISVVSPNYSDCADLEYKFKIEAARNNSDSTSYEFDFGDGTPLEIWKHWELCNQDTIVTHIYTSSSCQEGNHKFKVVVTIINSCGQRGPTNETSVIWTAPEAKVDTSFLHGCAVISCINFINESSPGFGQNCSSADYYRWNFGNGNISTAENPLCEYYPLPGIYNGYLIDSNYCGKDTFNFQVKIDPQPIASATCNVSEGCVPFNVSFTNTSQGNPTDYLWTISPDNGNGNDYTFINGTNQNSENPEIRFTTKGIYLVTLKASNYCNSNSINPPITITAKDIPDITLNNLPNPPNCAPFTYLAPSATFNQSFGTIDTYLWTFDGGDPSTSNSQSPDDIDYSDPGTFNIVIVAHNECGPFTKTYQIVLIDQPVITFFPNDTSLCKSDIPVPFVAEVDGTACSGWSSTSGLITPDGLFTPSTPGIYTINFNYGTTPTCSVSDSFIIEVIDAPIVNAGNDISVCIGDTNAILLDETNPANGSWTGHSNLVPSTPYWYFNPVGLPVGEITLTYSFQEPTTDCIGYDYKKILIEPKPDPDFSSSPVPPYCVGDSILFSPPPNPPGTSYRWYFNSDPPILSIGSIKYAFSSTGIHTIKLKAATPADCIDSILKQITVLPLPPQPNFIALPDSGCAPLTVQIIVDSAFLSFDGNSTWFLDGDYHSSFFFPPPFPFPSGNNTEYHTIKWELSNDCGTKTASKTVTVKPLPKSMFSIDYNSLCSPATISFINSSVGEPQSYYWDMDINGTFNGKDPPPQIYTTGNVPTTYQICLTTINDCGNDSYCKTFTVLPLPPQPFFTVPQPDWVCALDTVYIIVNPNFLTFSGISTWYLDGTPFSSLIIPSPNFLIFPTGNQIKDHIITWELSNDCDTLIFNKTIVVKPLPKSMFAMNHQLLCSPDTITFINSSVGDNYTWNFSYQSPYTGELPPPQILTTGNTPTTYTICLTAQNDCGVDSYCDSITILPNTIQAGFDCPAQVCVGDTVTFTSIAYDSSAIYPKMSKYWNFGDNTSPILTYVDTVAHIFQNDSISFTVTLTLDNTCSEKSISKQISVFPKPALCFTFQDSVCAGDTVKFNNCSPVSVANIMWDFSDPPTSQDVNPIHYFSSSGNYMVTLNGETENWCKGELKQLITILPSPNPFILPVDTFACSPLTISFKGDAGSYHSWDYGEGWTNTTTYTFVNNGDSPIIFPVTLKSWNPSSLCKDSITTQVTVHPSPISLISYENLGGYPQKVKLINQSSKFTDCTWFLPNGTVTSCDDQEVTFSDNGTSIIKLVTENASKCTDTAVISLETVLTGLYFPNAFMPESTNDSVKVFKAVGIGLQSYNLAVFDTWGNMIWQSDSINNTRPAEGWDGNDKKGIPFPQDVYIWHAQAVFIDGRIWQGQNGKTSGNVTLIR